MVWKLVSHHIVGAGVGGEVYGECDDDGHHHEGREGEKHGGVGEVPRGSGTIVHHETHQGGSEPCTPNIAWVIQNLGGREKKSMGRLWRQMPKNLTGFGRILTKDWNQ